MVDGCRAEQVRVLLRFLGREHHAMQLEREEVRGWVGGGGRERAIAWGLAGSWGSPCFQPS